MYRRHAVLFAYRAWRVYARRRLSRTTYRRLTLLAVSLLAFLAWLGKRDVATSHEARVGQTARLMAASGWPWDAQPADAAAMGVRPDSEGQYAVPRFDIPPLRVNPWLIPVLNGQVRLQKPPLPNWCAAALYRLTGHPTEFATRLVPALMGAIATFLVADLAGMILGRTASLIAGLVWAGTLTVVVQFRETTADPYLAFFTTLAVWAWLRASTPGSSRRRFGLTLLFYASLGLGVLSKGPFIFLHVGVALAAFAWSVRRRPRAGPAAHIAGIVVMLAIALPWPLYVLTHVENVTALWKMETTRGEGGRSIDYILSHLWELPARSFELALPWVPFWLVGIVASLPRKGRGLGRARRLAFPLLWYGATIAVFSFSPEKKSAYLLPVMPAQAMLVTIGLLAARRLFKPSAERGLVVAQALIAAGFAVGAVVSIAHIDRGAMVAAAVVMGIGLAMLAAGAARALRWRVNRWFKPLGAGVVLTSVVIGVLARAAEDNARSAKPFARYAGEQLLLPPANVLVPRLSAEASFYLPLGMRYDPAGPEVYDLVEPPRGKKFDVSRYKPDLPHGKLVSAEVVPVPGEPPNAHWRLVRIHVEPEQPATSPASRATPP
jgi:4-amino-4-deoxy-L-arabinose transferase-like glycosyltransferase